MPPRTGYSITQISLHWIIVALVGLQLLLNDGMQQAFDDRLNGAAGTDGAWATLHMIVGLSVLGLTVLRLGLRLTRGVPPPPADNPVLVTLAGNLTHLALYLFMFAMPLSGAIAWFGYSEIAAELHELGQVLLVLLIGLHVVGALAEHFLFGHDTIARIFRPEPEQPPGAPSSTRNR